MEDPLEDSKILHSGEGGDVEPWLETQNKSFVFVFASVLLSIIFFLLFILVCLFIFLNFITCISTMTFSIGQYSSQQGGN